MKKVLVVLFLFVFLIGCSAQEREDISDSTSEDESSENIEISETESELNHEEIMAANFSSIVGEYVNPEGIVIYLDEDGLNENERQTREVHGSPENGYSMGIHPKDELDGGYLLMVFPVGVEVPNLEGLTDITKIRICHGQAYPMSTDEVFTKKE